MMAALVDRESCFPIFAAMAIVEAGLKFLAAAASTYLKAINGLSSHAVHYTGKQS
jgi:hypothetical protein